MEQLNSKQGRNKHFHTKKQRDDYLKQQIQILKDQKEQKEIFIKELKTDYKLSNNNYDSEEIFLNKLNNELNTKINRKNELSTLILQNTIKRNDLQDQRKEIWKNQEKNTEDLNNVILNIEKSKQMINTILPKSIAQGISVIQHIAEEFNITGYHGPLIDLIIIKSEAFRTVVEVAANNALFHIIVDTDNTAAFLMNELEKRKAGRLTFLPLNRLKLNDYKNFEYPKSPDVTSLITAALNYAELYEPAVYHV